MLGHRRPGACPRCSGKDEHPTACAAAAAEEGPLELRRGSEISAVGTAAGAAVVQHVRDPVVFARGHRYRTDEAMEVTQDVP